MTASLFSETLAALPLSPAIDSAARLGYPAIELLCAAPHLDHARARRDAAEVAGLIRDAGLAVSALSLHNSFTERGALAEQLGIARTFIKLAATFDTRLLQLDPGRPAVHLAQHDHWHCLRGAVRELAAMARDAGVKLAFHTTIHQITSTLAGAERFLECAPEDCIGLTADFTNLRINGAAPEQVIARLGGRILHSHIKKGRVATDGTWLFSRLDRGLLDYTELLPRLHAAGYRGYLSIAFASSLAVNRDQSTAPMRPPRRSFMLFATCWRLRPTSRPGICCQPDSSSRADFVSGDNCNAGRNDSAAAMSEMVLKVRFLPPPNTCETKPGVRPIRFANSLFVTPACSSA